MTARFLLALALAAAPAVAQAPKSFQATVLMTQDPAAFRSAWLGPQPPRLPVTTKAPRGRPVYAMVIFSGCRPASDGRCNVSGRFSVLRPDGRPYQAPASAKLWSGRPAGPGRMLLANGSVGLNLAPSAALGTYKVRALVTDNVAGTSISVEQAVTAQ
ncbi:MAG TPA: hypothetical protein VF759_04165 [Allosphingosinicella sp.]|jgi:hypothetical protein